MAMKDPRMTAVSEAQPGFKILHKATSRKSERRSTVRGHRTKGRARRMGSKY